jgi:hypothetical protein
MSNWAACMSAESAAQASAAILCKGKVSDCEFKDNSRRLGDENFTCSATCYANCTTEESSSSVEQ